MGLDREISKKASFIFPPKQFVQNPVTRVVSGREMVKVGLHCVQIHKINEVRVKHHWFRTVSIFLATQQTRQ